MAEEKDPEKMTLEVRRGPGERTVLTLEGKSLKVPDGWEILPPGDAALSRRIKTGGGSWTVKVQKRNRWQSVGIWACGKRIAALKAEREGEKQDPEYTKKLEAGRARRAKQEEVYAGDFQKAVWEYLAFDSSYDELAFRMAMAIATHAVPVGSGTVARTKRIPIEQRAEAATIAWMRHQTTSYDDMVIPRQKGARREVRRMLAKRSKELLSRYRTGRGGSSGACPLARALGGE